MGARFVGRGSGSKSGGHLCYILVDIAITHSHAANHLLRRVNLEAHTEYRLNVPNELDSTLARPCTGPTNWVSTAQGGTC